jgi:hypothetical protein
MTKIDNPYATLNFNQTVDLIDKVGDKLTVLVEGHIGTGKTAILKTLAKRYPEHIPVYFDITTKDVGDFMIPQIRTLDGQPVCSFIPNEEFGLHFKKPLILILDELGKNKAVLNACLRLMLERTLGVFPLPEGSIVFATTNLASEGVGDNLPAHARNRICAVKMRKPTPMEWRMDFAEHNAIDPVVIATVLEYPEMLASFEDYERPEQNVYIHDPRSPRKAFVTPRSLEKASDILKSCRELDESILTHALIGVVGERAAMDILTILRLDNSLPSFASIVASPTTAKISKSGASICLIISKLIGNCTRDNFDTVMVYLDRLPKEAQALFARGVMSSNSPKRPIAVTNKKFTEWAVANGHYF